MDFALAIVNYIMKIMHNILQTLVETNIRSAFLMCYFEFNANFQPVILVFREENREKARMFQNFGILASLRMIYRRNDEKQYSAGLMNNSRIYSTKHQCL